MLYAVTFNETKRVEDIELDDYVRTGEIFSLTLDNVKSDYEVLIVGGPVISGVFVPSSVRVKKVQK